MIVKHMFANKDKHFFEVQRETKPDKYTVIISVSCDCQNLQYDGAIYNKPCYHILAALKHIYENNKVNPVFMVRKNARIDTKRNKVLNLVRTSNRKVNGIRGSEGGKHFDKKIEICEQLKREGKKFITEAEFTTGGIADILVLDTAEVIEIVNTESIESLAEKWNKYPHGLKLRIERV